MSQPSPYREFISNISLSSVLLLGINAERRSRSAIADGNNDTGDWEFSVRHEISDDGEEFNVRVAGKAETSTVSIELEYQLQYDFREPVNDPDEDIITRFLGESAIVAVAPYIREIVHTTGMRMQCDVPWLTIVGPQWMKPEGQD